MVDFDLTGAEAATFAQARSIDHFLNWTLGGLAVLWAIAMVFLVPLVVAKILSPTSLSGWLALALFAMIVVFGAVVLWLLIYSLRERASHGGRGPVRIDFGADGFTLGWSRGAPHFQSWSMVRRPLVVKDFSEAGYQAQMQVSRFLWIALTGEAAKAVAAEASRRGLDVSVERVVGSTGTAGIQTVISGIGRGRKK